MQKKQIMLFVAAALLFMLFSSSAFLQDQLRAASSSVGGYAAEHPLFGPIIFVVLAAGSVMLGPFTSAPLVPLVIPSWGVALTTIYLILGWLAGNVLAYALGRFVGYPLAKLVIPPAKLEYWTKILSQNSNVPVMFLFRLATPSETGYVFGILKYNFYVYMGITAVAEIPFAIFTTQAGAAFISAGWAPFIFFGAVWAVVIFFAFRLLNRRLVDAERKQ